jgi:exodeoxyribonuclease VII large subunit
MESLFPSEPPAPTERRKIYRVTELTRRIKAVLEDDIGAVWVEGEVSNAKLVGSGHLYFTLKDEGSQLTAAFFKYAQSGARVEVKDGAKLRVLGRITVYEPRGNYQLIVQKVEAAGQGSLQEAFEKLKEKLGQEGLFEAARKRPLPMLPRHIGIITSPTGAAIRDLLQVLGRRFPNLHILIAPVRVQGDGAASEIAAALDLLNQRADLEVLIVGRGGGSLEDLWAFNEEVVARALARSRLPVISAVGHEIDFTISDFVADLRAPTPSAAAELVVRAKVDFERQVDTLRRHLTGALQQRVLTFKNRFIRTAHSYVFREPGNLLQRHRQRVAQLQTGARRALLDALREQHQRLDEAALRLDHPLRMALQSARQTVAQRAAQLKALSPLAVLERGYSITQTADGNVLRDPANVQPGERMVTRLARGRIHSTVTEIERNSDHGRSKKR